MVCYPIFPVIQSRLVLVRSNSFYLSSTLTWIKPLKTPIFRYLWWFWGWFTILLPTLNGTINPTYQTSPSQSSGFDLASVTWQQQHGAPKTSHSKCSLPRQINKTGLVNGGHDYSFVTVQWPPVVRLEVGGHTASHIAYFFPEASWDHRKKGGRRRREDEGFV